MQPLAFSYIDALKVLRQQLLALYPIDEVAWEAFAAPWKMVHAKRKEVLTRTGDIEKYLYLVLAGAQRAYSLHNDKEVTIVFSYPHSFSGVVDSFLLQQPAKYHLECITDSTFLRISYVSFHELIHQHRSLETWLRLAITHVLAGTLQRQVELSAFSAEEKFITLLQRSPQVLNLIPHKYLASYIGVDPTNFSKLLANVRI